MADLPHVSTTLALAGRAADLSAELYAVQETCGHTSADVESVANEIAMLAATLWRLQEAINEDPDRYTESFNEDLAELTLELKIVFEEISECCEELQKADPTSGNPVSWLFKKSKVHHLQKHLEALKTTLVVMRTVLHRGKEYGTQPSPTLAEFLPHKMHEDRAILDAVFTTNRNAIIDLHNLEHSLEAVRKTVGADHEHGDMSASSAKIPPIPDVFPAAPRTTPAKPTAPPRRSFSRRGMRLGVHMSILDMGAHSAPDALKNKWIQTSRSHHPIKPMMTGARSPDKAHVRCPLTNSPSKGNVSPGKKTSAAVNHGRKTSHGWISTPTAGKLHKMIDHLELSHSSAISRLVAHGRRRSSVSKHADPAMQEEDSRRHRASASKQELAAVSATGESMEKRVMH